MLKKHLKIRGVGSLTFPDALNGTILHGGIHGLPAGLAGLEGVPHAVKIIIFLGAARFRPSHVLAVSIVAFRALMAGAMTARRKVVDPQWSTATSSQP